MLTSHMHVLREWFTACPVTVPLETVVSYAEVTTKNINVLLFRKS